MHLLREFSSIVKQWRKIALTSMLIEISQVFERGKLLLKGKESNAGNKIVWE